MVELFESNQIKPVWLKSLLFCVKKFAFIPKIAQLWPNVAYSGPKVAKNFHNQNCSKILNSFVCFKIPNPII